MKNMTINLGRAMGLFWDGNSEECLGLLGGLSFDPDSHQAFMKELYTFLALRQLGRGNKSDTALQALLSKYSLHENADHYQAAIASGVTLFLGDRDLSDRILQEVDAQDDYVDQECEALLIYNKFLAGERPMPEIVDYLGHCRYVYLVTDRLVYAYIEMAASSQDLSKLEAALDTLKSRLSDGYDDYFQNFQSKIAEARKG